MRGNLEDGKYEGAKRIESTRSEHEKMRCRGEELGANSIRIA
jgi:hypothetical protein